MRLFKSILLVSFFLILPVLARAEAPGPKMNDVSQKLSLLEAKISRLRETQNQIIQKNEEIDQELSSLRIWIRRNRN